MMIFVTGFVRWLNGLETEVGVMQFDRVLEAAEENADFTMLLHFMYDVGLPYIGLRQLMRQTSTPQMRAQTPLYYNMCMHMCRPPSVNKFHYAILSVHATFFYRNATPSLRNVWDLMSTVSFRGIPGHNIPIDHLIEKTNKAAKSIFCGIITEKRLRDLIPTFNLLLPAEAD